GRHRLFRTSIFLNMPHRMSSAIAYLRQPVWAALLCLGVFVPLAWGQNQPGEPQSEVVRINTELVQTGVMVFDKKGHFVEGLKPEQFELRVDGKRVQFSFFDRVTAWT